MPLFKVVLQKPVIGKNIERVSDAERARACRVLVVDAPTERAARIAGEEDGHSHGCIGLVSVERLAAKIVVLAP